MLQIIHLYAKAYGWTRDYILDNVYIDEHILQQEIIEEEKRKELLMQAHISLLPTYGVKGQKEFLDALSQTSTASKDTEVKPVDFEETKRAIEEFKQKLASM